MNFYVATVLCTYTLNAMHAYLQPSTERFLGTIQAQCRQLYFLIFLSVEGSNFIINGNKRYYELE